MPSGALPATDRTVSIGRIFSRAFSAIGAMPGTIVGLFAVFGTIPLVALHYVQQAMVTFSGGHPFATGPLVTMFVGLVFGYLPLGFVAPAMAAMPITSGRGSAPASPPRFPSSRR